MQITVFGAAGKVGRLVVEEALGRGFTVVAFVHKHSPFEAGDKLIIRKGDVYNAADVAAAIEGSDAVISALGSWGTKGGDVLSRFVGNGIPALEQQGVKRLVTLTGIGLQMRPSKPYLWALKMMRPLPAGKVFADAHEHVQLLMRSDLTWTTLCSPVMNNKGSLGYRLSAQVENPLATINRRSVAAALLDQIEAGDYLRQTAVIHRK